MLRKIKLRFTAIALAAIVVALCSQGSMAYYTNYGSATNVVTSGNITMRILQTTEQGTPLPEDGMYVMPGDVVSKVVSVENICDHPFYLRVKVVYGTEEQSVPAEECLKLNINTQDWVYHEGWYYYTGVVEPGETTPWFFSQVEIVGSKVDNSFIGQSLRLSVLAQAVQSENNPITDGDTTTANGWPAE